MPRPRPPHLHREATRHGALVWYVRVGKGPRIRIRAAYGTEGFGEAYQAALRGERPQRAGARAGTLAWLIARYRDSGAWSALAGATRKQRDNIFRKIIDASGKEPFDSITRKTIIAAREKKNATPSMARHLIETMRGLFQWALDAELVADDPTRDVKAPKKAGDGFHTWTEEECVRFEAKHPLGTRARLAYDVLLYTGLRRGDAVRLGRQHVKAGVATIKTEKTGEIVSVAIVPPLADSIAAGPTGDLAFIVGERGEPLKKETFGNCFREWCREADVPGSAHGLRKAGATRAALAGATVPQLDAMFGWRGGGMASLYTRKANRERLSMEGAKLMANVYSRTSSEGAGRSAKKRGKSDAEK